jgi:ABC-type branched-subunit amino acid transport system ATPase component/acetyl-CoA acetyltransferase
LVSRLEIDDVGVHYGAVGPSSGCRSRSRRGQRVAVLGPNGAGKSSLLGAISGAVRSDGGHVRLDSRDITHRRPERIARSGIAHVPEGRRVIAPLTLEENLRLPGAGARRLTRRAQAARLAEVYEVFPQLAARRRQAAGTLSGGEQQMLAIARALMTDPEFVLLDEPSMGLAPIMVDLVYELLGSAGSLLAEVGIVLVEQSAPHALAIADTVHVMAQGRFVFSGTPAEVGDAESLRSAYLGVGARRTGGVQVERGSAIVGVGATTYHRRGGTAGLTAYDLAIEAIVAAVDDAGLTVPEIDGFALFSGGLDTGLLAQTLGIPRLRFSSMVTGSGGGSAGSVGLARTAIAAGSADVVVSVVAVQQSRRMGAALAPSDGSSPYAALPTARSDLFAPSGMLAPGHAFAMLAQRHMHEFGTRREHFAEVAMTTRAHAATRPTALKRDPLTAEEYFGARMIADPMCLYDFCQESEGAVAVVTTSLERARSCRHVPVRVLAASHGGAGRWGQAITWMNMPEDIFASSGHQPMADDLYGGSGLGPDDVDVALLYDHFTPMVLMQLEDYGFCGRGEGGPFVAEGNTRWPNGSLPVNTHGGNLSEAYILGMTHVREGVEQMRGTAVNQVAGAQVALVTGGPAPVPVSGLLLGRGA